MKKPSNAIIRDSLALAGIAGLGWSAWLIYWPIMPGLVGVLLLAGGILFYFLPRTKR